MKFEILMVEEWNAAAGKNEAAFCTFLPLIFSPFSFFSPLNLFFAAPLFSFGREENMRKKERKKSIFVITELGCVLGVGVGLKAAAAAASSGESDNRRKQIAATVSSMKSRRFYPMDVFRFCFLLLLPSISVDKQCVRCCDVMWCVKMEKD